MFPRRPLLLESSEGLSPLPSNAGIVLSVELCNIFIHHSGYQGFPCTERLSALLSVVTVLGNGLGQAVCYLYANTHLDL